MRLGDFLHIHVKPTARLVVRLNLHGAEYPFLKALLDTGVICRYARGMPGEPNVKKRVHLVLRWHYGKASAHGWQPGTETLLEQQLLACGVMVHATAA